jgi:hypothetical protein
MSLTNEQLCPDVKSHLENKLPKTFSNSSFQDLPSKALLVCDLLLPMVTFCAASEGFNVHLVMCTINALVACTNSPFGTTPSADRRAVKNSFLNAESEFTP